MRPDPVGTPLVLEDIPPEKVEASNAFYRRRPPLKMAVAGEVMTFASIWPVPQDAASSQSVVAFTMGDISGELHLPRSRVERWLFQADPDLDIARLAPEHAALLLESLLSGELAWLEERLKCRIALTAIEEAAPAVDEVRFVFSLGTGREERFGALRLPHPDRLVEIGRLLDDQAKERIEWPFELPVPVSVYRGAVTVGIGDLQSLATGDVVLLDEIEGEAAAAMIVLGGRFVAPVELSGEGARLITPPQLFKGSKWEWIMGPKTDQAQALDEADLEDLPVSLVFELGRSALPLGEVKRLAPGVVVPLPEVAAAEAVDVIANGKRVGRGEIVRIGESLGVRIVRIFDNA